MTAFTVASTATQVASALSKHIAGKNVVITGVTAGNLAAEAARAISEYASLVVITGRSQEKLDEAVRIIKADVPKANLRPHILDLSSLAAVRKSAAEFNAYPENFHVLINNAAIMAVPYSRTVDGFESHMGVNHFAPFLFTALIYNRVVAAGTKEDPARIVNITSRGHQRSGIRFDDIDFSSNGDGETYNKWVGYGQSKTANVLFANEIARRAREKGVPVVAYSLHPGAITTTGLGNHVPLEEYVKMGMKNEKGEWLGDHYKSSEQGAATYLVAAFDPSILPQTGGYLDDADIRETSRAAHANSQEDGEKLWELSEASVKEKFVI